MPENIKISSKRTRLWVITVAYLTLAGVGAYLITGYTSLYRQERAAYAEQHDFKKRLLDMDEWLGERDSPAGGIEKMNQASHDYRQALIWAGSLALLSFLYLVLIWQLTRKDDHAYAMSVALTATALACLITGLFTPMMEISAFERDLEIPLKFKTGLFSLNIDYTQTFKGDLYFYYQSKSIVELITLLFRQQNFVVAISILLFSVMIPLSKLLLSGFVLLRPAYWNNAIIRFILEKTGKWSMADVFVVALFLGYLAFSNMQAGIRAESQVLVGLYFFLGYCLLAIVLPTYLKRFTHSKDPVS